MPIIRRFGSVTLRLYAGDHHPPHFHLVSVDEQVLVRIVDGVILVGDMRGSDFRDAMAWARAHRTDLMAHWQELNRRG